MADTIELSFVRNRLEDIELEAVRYRPGGSTDERFSVRGKTAGAYGNAGTFQWTSAVQGACAVILTTLAHEKGGSIPFPHIQGVRASLAASLDYALTKGPIWIADMFGTTTLGTLRAKKLFRVSNPNRKRPGPVTISLNQNLLPADHISVTLDGDPVKDPSTLSSMVQRLAGRELNDARPPITFGVEEPINAKAP